ncbi:hypothetical protein [Rubrivivax gelatinosus]|uniref:hypothetical protein n=1 Tax=Rubrivivax gelatinosus TaxID=28068 RepID=UPI0012FE2E1A|nr:hypothetical protein [Rubrivivax gelatinosus]MBG6083134.1 hypothetical protein [Rubrivivax gelatinosus]
MALAYAVTSTSRPSTGLCVIADSRLSDGRLRAEWERFRGIVRSDIGPRLYLAAAKNGELMYLEGAHPVTSDAFMRALLAAVHAESFAAGGKRVTRQQVKAALVERALWGLPPLTLADLRRQTGASYQTADAALVELQMTDVVSGMRDGPILLNGLRPHLLRKLADEHASARRSVRFVDPTGDARAPGAMAERLLSLRRRHDWHKVAVAGVLGAWRYFPDINITAAPRLDLSVYDGDQSFVARLDAGLVSTDDPSRKPVLVLHMQRDCRPPEVAARPYTTAARLDCLADLEELGLQADAREFAHALCRLAGLAA